MKQKKKNRRFIVHPVFIAYLVYSFLCGNLYFFCLYTISIVLHECVHFLVARRLGYKLSYMKLSISGASMKLENDEFFGSDELKVALSAPVFNLLIFCVLAGSWWVFPSWFNFTADFAYINLFIFLFNMLPVFSFDGGRIFVCVFEKFLTRKKATKIVRWIGFLFAFIVFLFFVLSWLGGMFNISLLAVSVFLISSTILDGSGEYKKSNPRVKLERIRHAKQAISVRAFVVHEDMRLIELFRLIKDNVFCVFVVIGDCGKMVCSFDEFKFFDALYQFGAGASIKSCLGIF